jgi:hypothetical protein
MSKALHSQVRELIADMKFAMKELESASRKLNATAAGKPVDYDEYERHWVDVQDSIDDVEAVCGAMRSLVDRQRSWTY